MIMSDFHERGATRVAGGGGQSKFWDMVKSCYIGILQVWVDATGSVVVVKYVYGNHGNHRSMMMLITDRLSRRLCRQFLFGPTASQW